MIVKRKLYSVMDEEGNQGYYLYDEATGEEKLFSVVEEEERMYARGVNMRDLGKGLKKINKEASKKYLIKERIALDPAKFASKDKDILIGLERNSRKRNFIRDMNKGSDIHSKLSRKQAKLDMASNVRKDSPYYRRIKYHTADEFIPGALLKA